MGFTWKNQCMEQLKDEINTYDCNMWYLNQANKHILWKHMEWISLGKITLVNTIVMTQIRSKFVEYS